jgi:hypothetical protein
MQAYVLSPVSIEHTDDAGVGRSAAIALETATNGMVAAIIVAEARIVVIFLMVKSLHDNDQDMGFTQR